MRTTGTDFPPHDLLLALADDLLDLRSWSICDEILHCAKDDQPRTFTLKQTRLDLQPKPDTATICDVSYPKRSISLPIEIALRPIEFLRDQTAQTLRAVQATYRNQWKEAITWMSCLKTNQNPERVMFALVIASKGTVEGLPRAVDLGRLDYRDLFIAVELANEDWQRRVEDFMADPNTYLQHKLGRQGFAVRWGGGGPFQASEAYTYDDDDRRNQLTQLSMAAGQLSTAYGAHDQRRAKQMRILSTDAARLSREHPQHNEIKRLVAQLPARHWWLDPRNPGSRSVTAEWLRDVREIRSRVDQVVLELRALGTYEP